MNSVHTPTLALTPPSILLGPFLIDTTNPLKQIERAMGGFETSLARQDRSAANLSGVVKASATRDRRRDVEDHRDVHQSTPTTPAPAPGYHHHSIINKKRKKLKTKN